jgi:tetratricopeptide (TPR) repeat protein
LRTLHRTPYTLSVVFAGATLLSLAACAPPGPDHERLGDRRYAEHMYVDALAEYRLAMQQKRPSAALRAKFGEAALRSGSLTEAAGAYLGLAQAEPSEVELAADGLVRTARLAAASRDMGALADALVALQDVAPQRAVGAFAVALGASSTALAKRPEAMGVYLEAAADATDPAAADSFLVAWGDVNARLGRCDQAEEAYNGVLRRSPPPGLVRQAEGGLAGCAVAQGQLSLSAGVLPDAAESFEQAIGIGEPDSIVRLAWLLLGDTRWAGGDTANALDAYRHAIAGAGDGDPVATRATAQMNRLLGTAPVAP